MTKSALASPTRATNTTAATPQPLRRRRGRPATIFRSARTCSFTGALGLVVVCSGILVLVCIFLPPSWSWGDGSMMRLAGRSDAAPALQPAAERLQRGTRPCRDARSRRWPPHAASYRTSRAATPPVHGTGRPRVSGERRTPDPRAAGAVGPPAIRPDGQRHRRAAAAARAPTAPVASEAARDPSTALAGLDWSSARGRGPGCVAGRRRPPPAGTLPARYRPVAAAGPSGR